MGLVLGALTLPLHYLQPPGGPISIMPATAVGFMLLLGCTGKSAQIPLYVWLPDAMAGPTPVSGRGVVHLVTFLHQGPSAPDVDYTKGPHPVVVVELDPPKSLNFEPIVRRALAIKATGVRTVHPVEILHRAAGLG